MKKVMLIILDGFGEAPDSAGNAISHANMPFFKLLKDNFAHALLETEGGASGLPEGQTGASEPGHITIGAGRIVWQPLERINQAFKTGEIMQNEAFLDLLKKAKEQNKVHLLGMVSDGGVHSHINHLNHLIDIFKEEGVEKIYLHAFSDGRDVPERSVFQYLAQVRDIDMASLIGRYSAMDRDKNWDRTRTAFDLLTRGHGERIPTEDHMIYRSADTDYYLPPFLFPEFSAIEQNDPVLCFNFRSDRSEQLTKMLTDRDYKNFLAFGPYTLGKAPNAFPPEKIKNNLGEVWEKHGVRQLRIAETEKFAHVSFFFNSQRKEPYKNEERILVPSPKCISYAEQPEMSAEKVTDKLLENIDNFDAVVLNLANADLVGHSGDFHAAQKACEFLDECLERIVSASQEDFDIIITADHGNSEDMLYPDGSVKPGHSINPVPCIFVTDRKIEKRSGGLKDLAPTLLDMQGIPIPEEMTGKSFVAD